MPFPGAGIQLANHYTLIGHFVSTTAGLQPWRSSLELEGTAGVIPQPADAIVQTILAYFIANLRNDCELDHLELRQWSRGPQPFAAQAPLWTFPVQQHGQKVANYGAQGANAVGREVVAFIRIANAGPKQGKQFLRQLLDTADIAAVPGGAWQFIQPGPGNVTPAKYATQLNLAGGMNTFMGAAVPGLRVVHFSIKQYVANHTLPFSSVIQNMSLVGPTVNKATRKNKK